RATALTLPTTTLAAAHFELIAMPPTPRDPMPRHDVIKAVRDVIVDLRGRGSGARSMPSATAPVVAPASINQLGDVYEFTYLGRPVAVRSTKGVADIVRLIEAHGGEVHCLDLPGGVVEEASMGETIDATARRQYEQRIRDLQGDIDEAEGNTDYERASRD